MSTAHAHSEIRNPNSEIIRVLLIEDNPGDARLIREMLAEGGGARFQLECVDRLSGGLERLVEDDIGVVLLDLGLPDSQGFDTFAKVYAQAPRVPIIVLSGLADEQLAIKTVQEGAQDYLVKGHVDSHALVRTIRYAIERKRTEELLRESGTQIRKLFEAIPDSILVHDDEGTILHINEIGAKQLEWSAKDLVGRNLRDIVTPENRASIADHIKETHKIGWCSFETTYVSRSGWQIMVEANDRPIKFGKEKAILSVVRDITERKQAEDALKNSEEKYRTILENIEDGYYEVDLNGNFTFFNASMCRILGYPQEEMMGMSNRQFTDKDNAKKLFKTFNEVYRTGEPTKEFDWQIIRKDGSKRYIEVSISLQKDSSGKPIGFRGVARDITERKQAEEELQRSYHKLRESLIATVNTLASTVEMRDPYTAGHQRRVTILACAIAEEMGLTEEQFDGLRMAGLIHDIGKINVPVDILNKPGMISELEFNIIATHPQSGYNILKEIEFPWPIAQIVLQHHERLDGSGYPQGLKNGGIMLEAKILAVADVVEAMASDRPYRPALGIEAALHEITMNKGILYDPDVTDICMRLFIEQGFTLGQEM